MPNWKVLLVRSAMQMWNHSQNERPRQRQQQDSSSPSASASTKSTAPTLTYRRMMTGIFSAALLAGAAGLHVTGQAAALSGSESAGAFLVAAMTRIGLVAGAFWLAWDSLRRPARWLPPGLVAIGIIGIVVVAVQPRMVMALLPAFGLLSGVVVLAKAFRRRS
ncbi:MAG: hypothetical protein AAF670_16995 [Planctomycetota bacterium]